MWKKLKDAIVSIISIAIIVAGIIAAIWFDFYVWSQKHPNAPTWTYFFREN